MDLITFFASSAFSGVSSHLASISNNIFAIESSNFSEIAVLSFVNHHDIFFSSVFFTMSSMQLDNYTIGSSYKSVISTGGIYVPLYILSA